MVIDEDPEGINAIVGEFRKLYPQKYFWGCRDLIMVANVLYFTEYEWEGPEANKVD